MTALYAHCARYRFQHFGGSTGYGHDDGGGREALDSIFAEIVGAEAAIVRPQVPPSLTMQFVSLRCLRRSQHN
jgi:cystathionine beta-lyase family protein involved in aluminum resistance